MPKPDLTTYDPFEKWPPHLQESVKLLGGSPLTLLSLALRYRYPEETSTPLGLHRRLIENQGENVVWAPSSNTATYVMEMLRNKGARNRLNFLGQVGYAGALFNVCESNPSLYPQALIGSAAKQIPGKEMRSNPMPLARLGLYALLGTTEERFSVPEIRQTLNLGLGSGNHMVEAPEKQGVLDVQRQGRPKPTLVQFTPEYRETMMNLSLNIEALSTPTGLKDEIEMAVSAVEDPSQFSHLMMLGMTWKPGKNT